ncbi:6-methylsalicylic acid decarboxylase atA [Sparassis crispa]|uniref:6-methylsalicylic acid decarboxylase atA n=1 Tax=Sparassis crispa TaxID=139825 RepID=A0A401G9L9_9APHY|nr:6-methylsalicylic acid decarboxylase atA [Sparassis crispa]GBE78862.1 6-methylsalicylic acid decarboxylase atA [Sparassis crispa]
MSNSRPPAAKPKFRVAICGGGMGGLALASTLGCYAHPGFPLEVHLYEAATEISTVGAGISVWPRTWRILELLGLRDQVARASVEPPTAKEKIGFTLRKSDRLNDPFIFHELMVPNGSTTMHRADMVDILRSNVPPSYSIHTSKQLLRYSEVIDAQSGQAVLKLHFLDGSTAETDVLIGADGIQSATRASLYDIAHARECALGEDRSACARCAAATPKWSGTLVYRCLISTEKLREKNPQHSATGLTLSYCGKGRHIITYPVSQGRLVNVVALYTIPGAEGKTYHEEWVQNVSKEEIVEKYVGWEPEVQELLQCVEAPSRWAIHVMDALPFSVANKVALLGDAVHAMMTHQGCGAGQAIEDAYILGRLLAHPHTTLALVPDVLRIYESIRLPFASGVAWTIRNTGRLYEFNAPGHYDGTAPNEEADRLQLQALGEVVREQWKWQWQEPFDLQWEQAEAALEHLVRKEIR